METRLKVIADPILKGQHPYHDHRYIVTADMEPEVFKDDGALDWTATDGSIIATMRDCEHQAEYARLFAAAPEMLAALHTALPELEYAHLDPEAHVAAQKIRAAIEKAEGK